jgi:hypothetical protein
MHEHQQGFGIGVLHHQGFHHGMGVNTQHLGAVLNDQMTGRVIAFNNATAVYTVDGQAAQGDAPAGRVRAMLTPSAARQSGAPGPVASPAALKPATATQVERR